MKSKVWQGWVVALALGGMAMGVQAAPMPSLAGAWQLVRVDNVSPDGKHMPLYGPAPQGLLLIDADGHYALQMVRAQRTRFAGGDKAHGSAEEYRAASMQGNAHYGRVEAAGGVLRFEIEHATFPNWDGTEQRRPFTLHGDELTYTVPTPTTGAGHATGEVSWRRVR